MQTIRLSHQPKEKHACFILPYNIRNNVYFYINNLKNMWANGVPKIPKKSAPNATSGPRLRILSIPMSIFTERHNPKFTLSLRKIRENGDKRKLNVTPKIPHLRIKVTCIVLTV